MEQNNNQIILKELNKYIGTAIINNPHKANCLSKEVIHGLMEAFNYFEEKKCRVIIIRAFEGAKIFSAGHDLGDFPRDGGHDPLPYTTPFEQLLHRIRQLSMPVIGMIGGSVWGGACDLAATCDLVIGTKKASFAITPAKIGIAYNTAGLTHFWVYCPCISSKKCCLQPRHCLRRKHISLACSTIWSRRKNCSSEPWNWPKQSHHGRHSP